MSPPKLPRHAPVMNISEPVAPGLIESLRHNLNVPVLHCLESFCSHPFRLYKPLAAHKRLNNLTSTLRTRNTLHMWFNFDCQVSSFNVFPELCSSVKSIQPIVVTSIYIHRPVLVHNIDNWQVLLLSNLIIIRVVTRRNFQSTSAKLHVYILVSNDWNCSAATHWYHDILSNQVLITVVLWMHTNRRISANRFRSSRCDREKFIAIFDHVLEII
mmetsp:Transcript_24704/g.44681  ORF Transcript_24704/g.44681 Transcript_24704/m.44681 type:complete len:214 (-) Transcript_24704:927-1568(-)